MAEWLKATDCKSVDVSLRWFESTSAHFIEPGLARKAQKQMSPCGAVVAHSLGKGEATGSSPVKGYLKIKT